MLRLYTPFASCYCPPGSSAGVTGFSENFGGGIAGLAAGRAPGQGNGGLYAMEWWEYAAKALYRRHSMAAIQLK
ncbi:MAG: hypothetical protein IPH16_02015 [Haliscomenobacter sp.]|nr:hypothetical protein [Haliscomenobacter sp.]